MDTRREWTGESIKKEKEEGISWGDIRMICSEKGKEKWDQKGSKGD